jgi:protein tyrosine phosphatase (PTP) superfamily phosphohydrolase (DUF442 family)
VEQDDQEEATVGCWTPNFHWLTKDVALGGCFPREHARELAHAHGIGAVIDLRAEDCDDEDALRAAGIELLHLPTPDMEPARPEQLDAGVAFVRQHAERGEKVLIHCQHGIGRSALLALCFLVDQGCEPLEAIALAKDSREEVSPSRAQYDGWAAWLATRGLQAPDYHTFGCIAYRHLAAS